MPSTNKAFAVVTSVSGNDTEAFVNFEFTTINPSDVPVAGGRRTGLTTAPLERSDSTHDVHEKIKAAVRSNLSDPTVDVVIV